MTDAVARIMAQVEALADGEVDPGWCEAWRAEVAKRDKATDAERAAWPTVDAVLDRLAHKQRVP